MVVDKDEGLAKVYFLYIYIFYIYMYSSFGVVYSLTQCLVFSSFRSNTVT